jgi:hypothetical protein
MAAVADGRTILAPNTELAAALFDAVERTYLHSGLDVWPTPRVRDFGGWLREQHAVRQLEDAASPRTLSEIEERELRRAAPVARFTSTAFPCKPSLRTRRVPTSRVYFWSGTGSSTPGAGCRTTSAPMKCWV